MAGPKSLSKKISLLGDFAVGKTSLIRRFVLDQFDDQYITTIGTKVTKKVLALGQDRINFQIWDIVGSIEYSDLQSQYLRGSEGAFLVCDLTRPESIDNLAHWCERIRQAAPSVDLVLLGNKVDLVPEGHKSIKELEMVANNLDLPDLLTSAKTGENVEEAFRFLGQTLLDRFLARG